MPAVSSRPTFVRFEAGDRSQSPAIKPRVIVPSVGMKLSVASRPRCA